eukprot:1940286-Amphidinium_carterae.1
MHQLAAQKVVHWFSELSLLIRFFTHHVACHNEFVNANAPAAGTTKGRVPLTAGPARSTKIYNLAKEELQEKPLPGSPHLESTYEEVFGKFVPRPIVIAPMVSELRNRALSS